MAVKLALRRTNDTLREWFKLEHFALVLGKIFDSVLGVNKSVFGKPSDLRAKILLLLDSIRAAFELSRLRQPATEKFFVLIVAIRRREKAFSVLFVNQELSRLNVGP